MKIDLHKISIREVIASYKDSAEKGLTAYNDKTKTISCLRSKK